MPTILRVGPYRFFFYAGDSAEPRHVHVELWLEPVRPRKAAASAGPTLPGYAPSSQRITPT